MSKVATLSASGMSVAIGVANTLSILKLKSVVEEIRDFVITNKDITLGASKDTLASNLFPDPPEELDIEGLSLRIDKLIEEITIINNRGIEAIDKKTNIDEIKTKLKNLKASIKEYLFEIESIVDITPPSVDIVSKWDMIIQKASVDDNGSMIQIKDCNLGFIKNRGNESAIHFDGLENPDWSMYTSGPVGTSTDGGFPSEHSGVTSTAIRMRTGSVGGVIVETPGRPLLNIESDGKTNVMSSSIGDLGVKDSDIGGFSHKDRYNKTDFSVCQGGEGDTKINSAPGQDLRLSSNKIPSVIINSSTNRTMELPNTNGVNTTFNWDGKNTISSVSKTVFRSGDSDIGNLTVHDQGVAINGKLYIDDIDVGEMIRRLKVQITSAEDRWRFPV